MDSKLPSIFKKPYYLDIVDEAWIVDTLSDDEIEVPPALDVDFINPDLPLGEPPSWTAEEKVDQWHDLGLDLWAKDSS